MAAWGQKGSEDLSSRCMAGKESSLRFNVLPFPWSEEMYAAALVTYYCLQMFSTPRGNIFRDLRCHRSDTQIFSDIMVELTFFKIAFIL